jgi:hypothetical protein
MVYPGVFSAREKKELGDSPLSNTIASQNHRKLVNMDFKSKYLLFEIVV